MPELIHHPTGSYAFLPGISPYSCGVVSLPEHEIIQVLFNRNLPWRDGFDRIDSYLTSLGVSREALCAVELRSPRPFSMVGFVEFNALYSDKLIEWGLHVNGQNPIARTNVCPIDADFHAPMMHGFSYVRSSANITRQTFIVAGAGELRDGKLVSGGIVRQGEVSPGALLEKAVYVCEVMESRLVGLGCTWGGVNAVNVYTVHPLEDILKTHLLSRMPTARQHGIRWHFTRPPVVDIEFEMDLHGVSTELYA